MILLMITLSFRANQPDDYSKARRESSAKYMETKRQNETVSEYDYRINYQQIYRAKINKSKIRRMEHLAYLSKWRKTREANESLRQRNERIQTVIENKNWKDQYTR